MPGAPAGGGHVLFFQGKTAVCNAARPRAQSAAVSACCRPCPSDRATKYPACSHLGRRDCQANWKNSALTSEKNRNNSVRWRRHFFEAVQSASFQPKARVGLRGHPLTRVCFFNEPRPCANETAFQRVASQTHYLPPTLQES